MESFSTYVTHMPRTPHVADLSIRRFGSLVQSITRFIFFIISPDQALPMRVANELTEKMHHALGVGGVEGGQGGAQCLPQCLSQCLSALRMTKRSLRNRRDERSRSPERRPLRSTPSA